MSNKIVYFNNLDTIRFFAAMMVFISHAMSKSLTKNKTRLNLGRFKFGSNWGKLTYGIYLLHPITITIVDVTCRVLNINYKS